MKNNWDKFKHWVTNRHWLIERHLPLINVWLNTPLGNLEKYWENKGEWKFGKKDFIKVDKDSK